ncbi:MAG TPA: RNA 3'-terminal phosphate cyclase [Isosphaeraceae bacterium]|nr:RNA 3'-terminal phosphate cyclase [Isosphaeraceae bacterium]
MSSHRLVTLDGSAGEGGGQILRTALTLSLLTGRPFRIVKIRANREKPGLRPQHLKAVEASALLCSGEVVGASSGSRDLTFRPAPYMPRDLSIDIGTAGSTSLILHTLHLPLALKADKPVRLILTGGTFNPKAPPYPFLESTWRFYMAALGLPVALAMPSAGFYPRGGGRLEAWIEPAQPSAMSILDRGPLVRVHGVAGGANLNTSIAERLGARAEQRLAALGYEAEITLTSWPSPGQGAAISLTVEHEAVTSTFVGLGERGKPSEVVADEAVDELLAYEASSGAVDPHSADQLLLPLALAPGRSEYTVTSVTEHLRTNAATIGAFLERRIRIEEHDDGSGRVVVE